MTPSVVIVDYGIGNLHNVARAIQQSGGTPILSGNPNVIYQAERLILPGVGAFAPAMANLANAGLIDVLREYAASDKPLLGICLGMQLLFDYSEEFGHHAGLGLVPGKVVPIPKMGRDGRPHKVPHIGWNSLMPVNERDWRSTLLHNVAPGETVYFVHSYTAMPTDANDRLADCDYHGCQISAAVQRRNVMGCQFHPEKSAATGLAIIARFLSV